MTSVVVLSDKSPSKHMILFMDLSSIALRFNGIKFRSNNQFNIRLCTSAACQCYSSLNCTTQCLS